MLFYILYCAITFIKVDRKNPCRYGKSSGSKVTSILSFSIFLFSRWNFPASQLKKFLFLKTNAIDTALLIIIISLMHILTGQIYWLLLHSKCIQYTFYTYVFYRLAFLGIQAMTLIVRGLILHFLDQVTTSNDLILN